MTTQVPPPVRRPQFPLPSTRLWALAVSTALTLEAAAAPVYPRDLDFTSMSLEELGSLKVTSVSKKSERLSAVPAAVSVITSNDILHSGALTFPDMLRLAPGVNVAQVDAAQSAVSVRGFNDTFSQKLLVLMDGRSVYTPLFSGTFWQAQDTMLDDLERIEVIRGPGSTVWGANAVNGVINLVSKPASETQGTLVTGGAGSSHAAAAAVRHGGKLDSRTFYRIYGKYDEWSDSQLVGGGDAYDAWTKRQAGFRVDRDTTTADRLTLQGDIYSLSENQMSPQVVLPQFRQPAPATGYKFAQKSKWDMSGGNLIGRWTHQFSPDSDLSVQGYYDRANIDSSLVSEKRDTFDLDLRHRFQVGRRNEIVWGGGFRQSNSTLTDTISVRLARHHRADKISNAFIQDEFTVVPDRLRLTVGSKIEHNTYTKSEVEPGARLSWSVTDKQTVWGSIARAVRTPSQFERDAAVNLAVLPPSVQNPLPTLLSVSGHPDTRSETLVAYELGYRTQVNPRLTIDAASFLNVYDNLRSTTTRLDMSAVPNYVRAASFFSNQGEGRSYGGELAVTWQTTDWWRLHGQVSVIAADLRQPANALTGEVSAPKLSAPRHQASLRSSMELSRQIDFDGWLRYVDTVTATGASAPGVASADPRIPSYVALDLRLAWHPHRQLELSVVGQNLFGPHREFAPTFVSTSMTEVARSVFGKITWKF